MPSVAVVGVRAPGATTMLGAEVAVKLAVMLRAPLT